MTVTPDKRRNFLSSLAAVIALLSITFIFIYSRSVSSGRTTPTASPNTAAGNSRPPTETELANAIDHTIDESDVAQARWGVFVMSTSDGHVLYSRNADKLFTPASNMKVYTTAAALDLLGVDYRWRTSVYAEKPEANDIIDGDLTIYGRGAPDLVSDRKGRAPSLAGLSDQLYRRGVRHVRGNIVGDESYFRGELYGPGWQWNDLQWYFGAEPSALSIDGNAIELTIAPGNKVGSTATVKLDHETGFVHLIDNATTGERSAPTTIGINRGLSDNDVRVWGEFPAGGRNFTAYLSVHNPALLAATLFKQALTARGIKVDGEPRSRDFRVAEAEKFDPQKNFEMASEDSETLAEIVRQTNKESNNLYAELILRTLGKERGTMAPDSDPHKNRERGDDQAGTAVIGFWLSRNGIGTDGLAIRDGSGLSRLDLVTPEVTARLLVAVARTNAASAFRDSLPVAGRDGTLKPRLIRSAGRIFAKTGTLTYHHSLSGYALTESEGILAFSIMCNDATGRSDPVRIIDRIASLLASYKATTTPK